MDVRVKSAKPKKWKGEQPYLNLDAVYNVVHYILRGAEELPISHRLYGSEGIKDKATPDSIINEMMHTKKVFGHIDGCQCKHLVLIFEGMPNLSRRKIRRKIERTVGYWKKKYQLFWGVHCAPTKIEGRFNWHVHLMLNNVDMMTGNRLKITNKVKRDFEKHITKIWKEVDRIEADVGCKSIEAEAGIAMNTVFDYYDADLFDFS